MDSSTALLSVLILIPFLGMLFVLTSKESADQHNSSNVAIFAVVANLIMIWRVFMLIDESQNKLQLFEKFQWLTSPEINIVFAVDNLSLLMILALHLVVLIGMIFVHTDQPRPKALNAITLLFVSMTTGLFVAADIFSFAVFFEAMFLPLFILIGMFGGFKKFDRLGGFFIYNLTGTLILLMGILLIYRHYGCLTLDSAHKILWKKNDGWYIWGALALGLISRIPIWPFHYWIASISSKLHNPLVFICAIALPLSGLYGLIRFWPNYIPIEIARHFVWLNVIGSITMLFISLIGFIHKDRQYKVFAFVTVYDIMYLLGIFSREKLILSNLGYALFGFVIIAGALEVLSGYIYALEQRRQSSATGFLCRAKRLSLLYSFITFAAIGFPISAMFTNNFLILSQLLTTNIQMGVLIMLACVIVSATLISEMFKLKDSHTECTLGKNDDLSFGYFIFMIFVIFMLLMSFIRPLWFVINE
jgi:NADH-quinone oxidoreductase subunit M